MTKQTENPLAKGLKVKEIGSSRDPRWASSLKQLYDSVVDEPLPDSFKDLLEKLEKDAAK